MHGHMNVKFAKFFISTTKIYADNSVIRWAGGRGGTETTSERSLLSLRPKYVMSG
jgi:hypothetical protein